MKITKIVIAATLVSVVVAIPVSHKLRSLSAKYSGEHQKTLDLNLRIDSIEKKAQQQKLELESVQKEKEQLQKDLQAKRDRQEADKQLALTQQGKVPAVVVSSSCEAYKGLVMQYDWDHRVALAVMKAESGCNPSSENKTDNHATCHGSRGLFQIGCDSTPNYDSMLDASTNVAQAYNLYSRRGWQPWGAFNNGSYLRYL